MVPLFQLILLQKSQRRFTILSTGPEIFHNYLQYSSKLNKWSFWSMLTGSFFGLFLMMRAIYLNYNSE